MQVPRGIRELHTTWDSIATSIMLSLSTTENATSIKEPHPLEMLKGINYQLKDIKQQNHQQRERDVWTSNHVHLSGLEIMSTVI